MFMNLDTLPSGSSMYTVAVTAQPVGTPPDEIAYDEIDVVARRFATMAQVVAALTPEDVMGYEGQRVVGVLDQSVGERIYENAYSTVVLPS